MQDCLRLSYLFLYGKRNGMLQTLLKSLVALHWPGDYALLMRDKTIGREEQASVGVRRDTRKKFKTMCDGRGWQLGPTTDKLMEWFTTLPAPVQEIFIDRMSVSWGQAYAQAFDDWAAFVRSSLPAGAVKVVNTMSKRGRANNSGTAH